MMSRSEGSSPAQDRVRRRVAWAAPVGAAVAVAAGVALTTGSASGASPNLPPRTATQLLAAVMSSTETTLSGTVRETANLGIPSLPGDHSGASLSWQTFLAGSHSARVWVRGPDKQRVALTGELSEADVIRNGADLWTYTSDTNTVTHSSLPKGKQTAEAPSAADATPAAVAARVLKAVTPSTKVSIDSSKMIAGRAAYTLVIQPRDVRSTVRKVTIAVDATKSIPLQVAVYGSGSSPAFQTGFTRISFATPAASIFAFHMPAGATVSKDPFGLTGTHGGHEGRSSDESRTGSKSTTESGVAGSAAPRVLGEDWTSVIEVHGGRHLLTGALGGTSLHDLTTPIGSTGDRLLHTGLLNALILTDGRAFVGAVQPSVLEQVAASTPN